MYSRPIDVLLFTMMKDIIKFKTPLYSNSRTCLKEILLYVYRRARDGDDDKQQNIGTSTHVVYKQLNHLLVADAVGLSQRNWRVINNSMYVVPGISTPRVRCDVVYHLPHA